MTTKLEHAALIVAGQRIDDVWDRVRRYCGLSWSGGAPETWAYPYYDAVHVTSPTVTPVDVLAAGALHPGLSRVDLAFFRERSTEVQRWLDEVPLGLGLRDADDNVLAHLGALSGWTDAPTVTLLSKVLHRKRPDLIPLVDRHVLDIYRPLTGQRSALTGWQPLLHAIRDDLAGPNAAPLARIAAAAQEALGRPLSHLRILDVAIWMGSQGR